MRQDVVTVAAGSSLRVQIAFDDSTSKTHYRHSHILNHEDSRTVPDQSPIAQRPAALVR